MPGDGRDEPPAAWDAGGAEPSSSVSTYRPWRIVQRQRHGAQDMTQRRRRAGAAILAVNRKDRRWVAATADGRAAPT